MIVECMRCHKQYKISDSLRPDILYCTCGLDGNGKFPMCLPVKKDNMAEQEYPDLNEIKVGIKELKQVVAALRPASPLHKVSLGDILAKVAGVNRNAVEVPSSRKGENNG